VVCAFFAQTTKHGAIKGKTQDKKVKYFITFNLIRTFLITLDNPFPGLPE
jgi:hypothetical protein